MYNFQSLSNATYKIWSMFAKHCFRRLTTVDRWSAKFHLRDSGNLESEKKPPMIPVTIFKIYGSFLKTKFYLELVEKISFYLIMSI